MNDKRAEHSRQYWDNAAPSFDDEPDHGLRDPVVLKHWTQFLQESLPQPQATILDIGCGTGSLSVILAGLGHHVTGIDLSPSMISLARAKAASRGVNIGFQVMDAASPRLPLQRFDAIVCRHLLWTLPEPGEVLERWAALLKEGGRLLLIEGYWGTGAGLRAKEILAILPVSFTRVSLQSLGENSKLWGREVSDERYAILADKRP